MARAPIILASKHAIGILQLEKVELQGKLSVKSLQCFGSSYPALALHRQKGQLEAWPHVEGPSCHKWLVQVVTQPFM